MSLVYGDLLVGQVKVKFEDLLRDVEACKAKDESANDFKSGANSGRKLLPYEVVGRQILSEQQAFEMQKLPTKRPELPWRTS